MIKVTSRERLLPRHVIIECLQLLEEEYTSLYIELEVHSKNSLKLERNSKKQEMPKGDLELVLSMPKGKIIPKGIYLAQYRKIKLFPFTVLKKDYEKLQFLVGSDFTFEDMVKYITIFTMYHEVRHAWQHVHDTEAYENEQEITDLTLDFDKYQNLPTELDADNFEREQVQKHGPRIREILGVKSTLMPEFPKYDEMK